MPYASEPAFARIVDREAIVEANESAEFSVARIVGPFEFPWSIGFLPDASILVTERTGRLQKRIAVCSTIEEIVAGIADERVCAAGTAQAVIAKITSEEVIARSTIQYVRESIVGQRIIAGPARDVPM